MADQKQINELLDRLAQLREQQRRTVNAAVKAQLRQQIRQLQDELAALTLGDDDE